MYVCNIFQSPFSACADPSINLLNRVLSSEELSIKIRTHPPNIWTPYMPTVKPDKSYTEANIDSLRKTLRQIDILEHFLENALRSIL